MRITVSVGLYFARAFQKLAWISEVCMLNLGLRKVKPETTALQYFTGHRSMKNTNIAHQKFEITPNTVTYRRFKNNLKFTFDLRSRKSSCSPREQGTRTMCQQQHNHLHSCKINVQFYLCSCVLFEPFIRDSIRTRSKGGLHFKSHLLRLRIGFS